MLVTMIVISALFAGAAVLVSMQMAGNKSSDIERNGLAALYCAEAGLVASHQTVAANYANWNASLCTSSCGSASQPSWATSASFSHDLDGDGVDDFYIYIKDNDDETGSAADNKPGSDADNQIFIVSTCTKYPDYTKQVMELIKYTPTPTCYQSQDGGCNGRGNNN